MKINSYGTECDRIRKFHYSDILVTMHLYNKPKNKKGSKIMIQGSKQTVLCSFVFDELPVIYKIVCEKANLTLQVKSSVENHVTQAKRPTRAVKRLPMFTPIA